MFKKFNENKKKGFTLVELIVVLVILAILAALLIPALTGYIDKAKNKSIVAETRQAVMAAQTLADEVYAKQAPTDTITFGTEVTEKQIQDLAEVKGKIDSATFTDGKVTKLVYTNNGKTCTYDPAGTSNTDGDYNVAKASDN